MSVMQSRIQALCRLLVAGSSALLVGACAGGAFQARPEDIPQLERAASASPADTVTRVRLGAAYFSAGRYEDARGVLSPLVAAGTRESAAYLYLGLTSEKLETWSAARSAYAKYGELDAAGAARHGIVERLALVSRRELREQARQLLAQEQQLTEQAPTSNSIAVMPFQVNGLSEELQPLQTALSEMIVTDLGYTQLRAVERVRVQSMLSEMRLGLGGVAGEETSARVGRLLRAQHVVQGQVTGSGDQQLAVAASVLNTVQRTAGDELSRRGQVDAIFDLEKQLVFGILEAIRYPLSPSEREQINENRVANLMAFLAYGRGLDALDRGEYDNARDHFREATRLDPGFGAAQLQQGQATQLSQAEGVSVEQVAQTPAVAPTTTADLAQLVVNDLNPSGVNTLNTTEQQGQTVKERGTPGTENQSTPPLTQATTARVIIPLRKPGT